MNKTQLVEEIHNQLGPDASKAEAERALAAVTEAIKTGIRDHGQVQLIGFGTFEVTERAARKGVNPKTGEPLDIAASKGVKFKVGASLKSLVNDA